MTMKLLVFNLILITTLFSCQRETFCEVKNPLNNLSWLKKIKKHGYEPYRNMYMNIYQCNYHENIDGFFIEPCIQCYTYTAILLSCDGTVLFDGNGQNVGECEAEWNVNSKELIWTNVK